MPIHLAVPAKNLGIAVFDRVDVGGAEQHEDPLSGANRAPIEHGVANRSPRDERNRCFPPQQLLECMAWMRRDRRAELRVLSKACEYTVKSRRHRVDAL